MNIETWEDFKAMIDDNVKNRKDFYYRGQLNPEWRLNTSFHRYTEKNEISMKDYLAIAIQEIYYHIVAQEDEIFNLEDKREFGAFLGRIQHHGFPTPLLDWTLSPYIATYFAFREIDVFKPQVEKVRIFMFDYQLWEESYESILDLRSEKQFLSVLRPFSKHNRRLISQMGSTTLTNISDIQAYIESCEKKSKKKFLYHVSLPVEQMTDIMNELQIMGINEMTLFPGIDGVCNHFKDFYFNRI